MSFNQLLNWILGRPQPEKDPPTTPEGGHRERRTSTRLDCSNGVVQIHGVGDFPLVDLGQGGLSLKPHDHPILANPVPGMILPARIRLGVVFFETELRVCSLHAGELGCAFNSMPGGHSRALADFLKPRMLGTTLREIKAANRDFRWFQGEEGTQILFWPKPEGGFSKVDFYFMDYLISFDGGAGVLKTGFVRTPFLGGGGGLIPGPETILFHQSPSYRALKLGRIIFEHSSLPEEIRTPLESFIYREEKCSFSRVLIGDKDRNITFEVPGESGSLVFRVASLCSTAISMVPPESTGKGEFPIGTTLQGRLRLSDREIPANFKVVFRQDFLLGGGLKLLQPGDNENLSSFLAPRLLGKSLEAMAPPVEDKPFAPNGSRSYLFVGVHNTHLLSLIMPPERLLYGRLSFCDRIIVWDRNALSVFSFPEGLIFPSDWEIPSTTLEKLSPESPDLVATIREILHCSNLPPEILKAWETILPAPPGS